jgi:hypothetical protein
METERERSVLLEGFPIDASLDCATIYFQSKKLSGGGDVDRCEWTEDGKQVRVIFDEAQGWLL